MDSADSEEFQTRINEKIEACIQTRSPILFLSCMSLNKMPKNIPSHVTEIICNTNDFEILPEDLPQTLKRIEFNTNKLKQIKYLPPKLELLAVHLNELTEIPDCFPNTLQVLYCGSNKLKKLPPLPDSLLELFCFNNILTSLPNKLPPKLERLICFGNKLTRIPDLPTTLQHFDCYRHRGYSSDRGNEYLYIPNEIAKRFGIGETPNYSSIFNNMKKIYCSHKRVRHLKFCDQLQVGIDGYIYRPMGMGYMELTLKNKNKFIDL